MGAIGGVIRATSGPPSYSTISSVKNPVLQGSIDSSIAGLGGLTTSANSALDRFTSDWNAQTPATATRTNEEIGALGQFYNGSMANQLAQLRAQRASAMTNAANVASQQAIASQNRSRLTGDAGAGSYNTRLAMANLTPIKVQAALDDANQARADLGYVTQNQIGLAGQRNQLANAQAARGLVPTQQRLQTLGQINQYTAGLTNLDQANKFYGLQKAPNMWADVADSLDQGILNAAAIYSSMGTPGMSEGGYVEGPGTGTSDSIPVRLSKGEYVVPADVVRIPGILPLLEKVRHLHRMHQVGKHQEALKISIKREKEHKANRAKRGFAGGGQVRGYADGGFVDGDYEAMGFEDDQSPMSGGGGMGGMGGMGRKGGGGGGGGGLAGSAQQLGARVDADLTAHFAPPAMINTAGQGVGNSNAPVGSAGGFGSFARGGGVQMPIAAPVAPGSTGDNLQGTRYFHPDNWNSIPDEWKVYGAMTAAKYNDPNSPHYIPPGTYE